MNEDRKKKKKGLIIGIIAGVVALAGLGIGAAFLFGGNKGGNDPTSAQTESAEDPTAEVTETEPGEDVPSDDDLISQLFWNVDGRPTASTVTSNPFPSVISLTRAWKFSGLSFRMVPSRPKSRSFARSSLPWETSHM